MTLVIIHLVLWLLWSLQSWRETRRRPDRDQVPLYVTGTVGDVVGFSLIAYTTDATLRSSHIDWPLIISCCLFAGIVTYRLHTYWKQQAHWQTGSMYHTPTGAPMCGAYLHNLYVWFVTTIICYYLVQGLLTSNWTFWQWFLAGISWYAITCIIDRWRGVI